MVPDPRLAVSAFGRAFPNPVGVAAGYDKNAVAIRGLAALGFGHVEVGTVTPVAQQGRPRPRLFRLPEDEALINRLGFPNEGMQRVVERLHSRKPNGCVLGVNIGPNAAAVADGNATADYLKTLEAVHPYADYVSLNLSSPNTQGLRLLQAKEALRDLLAQLFDLVSARTVTAPVLLKISPDLAQPDLYELLDVVLAFPVAGIIATNTTLERPTSLISRFQQEAGGLSGRPLRDRSTAVIRDIFQYTQGKLPIIGVGGVFTSADVVEKLRAGASLVQLYTALVYQGPLIARHLNRGLLGLMEREGIKNVGELVGVG